MHVAAAQPVSGFFTQRGSLELVCSIALLILVKKVSMACSLLALRATETVNQPGALRRERRALFAGTDQLAERHR